MSELMFFYSKYCFNRQFTRLYWLIQETKMNKCVTRTIRENNIAKPLDNYLLLNLSTL